MNRPDYFKMDEYDPTEDDLIDGFFEGDDDWGDDEYYREKDDWDEKIDHDC